MEKNIFDMRIAKHYDELKWLYNELYPNRTQEFNSLIENCRGFYNERKDDLKALDNIREKEFNWYRKKHLVGMMMYTDAFAGNLKGVINKLDYTEECGVNYLHLMPLLKTPKGRSDGGYAVADFRTVQKDWGTIEDLEELCDQCRKRDMSVCLDFVMNHTSEEHQWAQKAKNGERDYMDMYYFYDDYSIPEQYEATVPQVFPTTAPGNFTWLENIGKYVLTTFYPYQWDLNYGNPVVLNEMIYNLLFLANKGVDIFRIDAVPYIWKQLGTNCRNLPQVHTIVRIIRMICEVAAPSVILLGEVVMEPSKVVPYFGSVDKPECHMLYNVTTMATTWHTVATKNTALLKYQTDAVCSLPKEYVFLNYLRCHDDIGWGLDYDFLSQFGTDEVSHKRFLSEFFTGNFPFSFSRGELYNDDKTSGDARQCGTTASLCGIENAQILKDKELLDNAVALDVMLHAYMFTQSGIPVLYSGDEIGQTNDYSYHCDKDKAQDSRYLHRGKMNWNNADKRKTKNTAENTIFTAITKMEEIRKNYSVFSQSANVRTANIYDDSLLCLIRENKSEKLVAVFNFSPDQRKGWLNEDDCQYKDLLSGSNSSIKNIKMPPYGVKWLYRKY